MTRLDENLTVQELCERHPEAIPVFMKRRMLCIGCPSRTFHTLADVARIHNYTLDSWLDSLQKAIEGKQV